MRITLDLPPRELNPNCRVHWAKKARAVKFYRQLAWIEACKTPARRARWERAELRTTWYLPDKRRRDPDNLMASLKPALDGVVDAEALTDDRYLVIHPPTLAIDRARPRVELEVTPL